MEKPIQKYSKHEKIAAIREYTPYRPERNIVVRYLLAVRRDDSDLIAYFESFGKTIPVIINNARTYERGLLYGISQKKFNEYGWITGMLPIIEQIDLDKLNSIYIGQSISGVYAVTVGWSTGGAGGGSHPSVWDEPYADYKEAVKQGINELQEIYANAWDKRSDSCNYNENKIRQLINRLKEIQQQYLEPKQLSLF